MANAMLAKSSMGPGLCVATTTVQPSSRLTLNRSERKLFSATGSSMDVGSSRRSSLGRMQRTEARARSWRCPPERLAQRLWNHGSIPKK